MPGTPSLWDNVTVKWHNVLRNSVIRHDVHSELLSVLQAQTVWQGWVMIKLSQDTHNKYCDILLIFSTCTEAGTAAWEYELPCSGWHLPGTNEFQWLEQDLLETSVAPMAHMNACHPQTADASRWRWHNCSPGMRVVEKFIQYHTRIKATPTDIPWCTSWRQISAIPLPTEHTSISRWSSPHDSVFNVHNDNLLAQDNHSLR